MKWEEVRQHFPNEWVVFEAVEAYSKEGHRNIDDVVIIDRFNDSLEAMKRYKDLHRENPHKEIYFLHTSRDNLRIREKWVGVKNLK